MDSKNKISITKCDLIIKRPKLNINKIKNIVQEMFFLLCIMNAY